MPSFPTSTQIQVLDQSLGERLPNAPWQEMLEICAVTGVANSLQLQGHLDISRKQLLRILRIFKEASVGLPPLINVLDVSIPRPTTRGRPPNVYQFGESGAAILNLWNAPNARASGLEDPHAIAHALAMLHIHLAALQANKDILTDKPLHFGDDRRLRVDHRVQLPDKRWLFYEVEQDAAPKRLTRIREALTNRWDFFASPASDQTVPQVRTLFNLRRGRVYERSVKIWEQALGMLKMERGTDVPFTLLGMPIPDFLEQPEWQAELSERWDDLRPLSPAEKLQSSNPDESKTHQADPDRLKDDWRYLENLLGELQIDPPEDALTAIPLSFFYIVDTIYEAAKISRFQEYTLNRRPPLTAIALIRAYLERHPELKARLKQLMKIGKRRAWWRDQKVMQHMQRIIDAFLDYHGWYNRMVIWVDASVVSGGSDPMFPYRVQARLTPGLPEYLQSQGVQLQTDPSDALAWVLWALFAYGKRLGLGKPSYW